LRAVDIVERALALYGTPLYVRKEIIHNGYVVDGLRRRGVVFVETLEEVPAGARVIFSAHGVSPQVREDARARRPAGDRRDLSAGHEGAHGSAAFLKTRATRCS